MTTQAKHTPGRLEARAERAGSTTTHYMKIGTGNCYLTRGVGQTEEETRANAARLAHCWNNHDALLEALQACITDDGALAWRNAEMAGRRLEAISNIARAAIQAAKEQKP